MSGRQELGGTKLQYHVRINQQQLLAARSVSRHTATLSWLAQSLV